MKHLGDITKISGRDVPTVEVIIGGSPCQDLSVAGKRAGLDGERSGLFMEQIRLIREMRENDRANGRTDEFIRPRFMVWENVPGAFSSNGGEDFRIVLEETASACAGCSIKKTGAISENRITDYTAVCIGNGQADQLGMSEKVGALNCMHDQQAIMTQAVVRRLTPLECERLQGFPDGWTDIGDWTDSKGKKHKAADSPRYKALGNSIALPSWFWVLSRLNKHCKEHTMASLFDGIGGFPLIWERINGKGLCLWASEIEEFPMAVTRIRFGGD